MRRLPRSHSCHCPQSSAKRKSLRKITLWSKLSHKPKGGGQDTVGPEGWIKLSKKRVKWGELSIHSGMNGAIEVTTFVPQKKSLQLGLRIYRAYKASSTCLLRASFPTLSASGACVWHSWPAQCYWLSKNWGAPTASASLKSVTARDHQGSRLGDKCSKSSPASFKGWNQDPL